MIKFKSIRDFINFKRLCPLCQVPLATKIHTWKLKANEAVTIQDRGWLVVYNKESPIYAININTNKVQTYKDLDPRNLTQQCYFKIKCYCKNLMCFKEDNNTYHYMSDTLFFEEKNKRIYDFFLWKEKIAYSADYFNLLESNYQVGKSFLTVSKMDIKYKEYIGFFELPIINLHELQSVEDIASQIKICTLFS